MAPTAKPQFAEGEKVLCFHGPLIYEAKCLKSKVEKDAVKYFIHYAGWNKNWDEWVPESRVLKFNAQNVQWQKEVQRNHSSQTTKNKKTPAKGRKSEVGSANTSTTSTREESRASSPTDKEPVTPAVPSARTATKSTSSETPTVSGSEAVRKKRSRVDPNVETEEQYHSKLEVQIKMPEELKVWLADDWDIITRQQKLANLPARVTVDTILNNYVNSKKSGKTFTPAKESILNDVVNGIREYFNVALGCQLLYKFERPQYKEILTTQPETPLSHIYGGLHLLRLFVKMGSMLAYTSLDEKSMQHVLAQIHDLLKYIVLNRSSLLSLQDYGNAPPEYHRLCE